MAGPGGVGLGAHNGLISTDERLEEESSCATTCPTSDEQSADAFILPKTGKGSKAKTSARTSKAKASARTSKAKAPARTSKAKAPARTSKAKIPTAASAASTPKLSGAQLPDRKRKAPPRTDQAAARGVDLSLPPLSDIEEIFQDITEKALQNGFGEVIKHLGGRSLRVVTMCSGTESPLLALQLISESLAKRENPKTLKVQHLFSAEIVPYKQAYIERNFQPPIIFRDITEFAPDEDGCIVATTAFGAKVAVPTDVDVLVAGFSCVDFSSLNNNKKKLDDNGESGDTFNAVLRYINTERPPIVVLENVCNAPWNEIRERLGGIDYSTAFVKVDTKNYYIPHTRQRGYLFGLDARVPESKGSEATKLWPSLMKTFERRASCSVEAFLLSAGDVRVQRQRAELAYLSRFASQRETDWTRCQGRYEAYRQQFRLGYRRPLTHWVDSGTCRVPDYADRAWFKKQVERIWETLDLSWLRNALPERGCYDSQFKTRVWELSQNIDRFTDTAQFGIASCQTPTGQPYLTERGGPLTGYETLSLQGIPIHKISFTSETNNERQDLAGNAMTTTVVGSAIIAALLVGFGALGQKVDGDPASDLESKAAYSSPLNEEEHLFRCVEKDKEEQSFSVRSLQVEAEESARRCYCEGQTDIATKPIQMCQKCRHTTCTRCGGNPPHSYGSDHIKRDVRMAPQDFIKSWKAKFPTRLKLHNLPDIEQMRRGQDIQVDMSCWSDYLAAVNSALESDLQLRRFDRSELWKVVYESAAARLELSISGTPTWRFYAKAPPSLPGSSKLRGILERPFARAVVTGDDDILAGTWEWFIPAPVEFEMSIEGHNGETKSWMSLIGLEEYEGQRVSRSLRIKTLEQLDGVADVSGDYELLPDCGTACGSLHKRKELTASDNGPLFFFLDPSRIGDPAEDCFVFSYDHRRLDYGETREVVARISSIWRPWSKQATRINGHFDGRWIMAEQSAARLSAFRTMLSLYAPSQSALGDSIQDAECCSHLTTIVAFKFMVPPGLTKLLGSGRRVESDDISFFSSFAWVFDQAEFESWVKVNPKMSQLRCRTCSPDLPPIRWKLADEDNPESSIVPYEDQQLACIYERRVKERPPVFWIEASLADESIGHIKAGLNIQTLVHRATAQLDSDKPLSAWWRCHTGYLPSSTVSFPPFRLTSNAQDEMYTEPLNTKFELRPEQRRSLTWMRAQEAATVPPFICEAEEEAILSHPGWRAVARAQQEVFVRGGVLADRVSYGKTITTLAMIHAQFLEQTKDQIVRDLKKTCRTQAEADLIPIAATLIVCPRTLTGQWHSEIEKFLGVGYRGHEVIAIGNVWDLKKYCIGDYQRAKIVIFSWTLFQSLPYMDSFAGFAAVPEPTTTSGRAFAAWLDYALKLIPSQIKLLQTMGVSEFQEVAQQQFQDSLDHEDFKATVPSKRLRGEAYARSRQDKQSAKTAGAGSKRKASTDIRPKRPGGRKTPGWESFDAPILHLFRFNRIVVDEFTYLEGQTCASILCLKADKRWVLSGTPPLREFADVKKIAAFLDINLGMDDDTPIITSADNIKSVRAERTAAEKFQLFREARSVAWHERRHHQAQMFLDRFVRQNDAVIGEIAYEDLLKPVLLLSDQRAIYEELSQHLHSQDMRIKRTSVKLQGDRENRVNMNLENVGSPEEALLMCCTLQTGPDLDLEALIAKRQAEYKALTDELRGLIGRAEKLKAKCGNADVHYSTWKTGIEQNSLGDAAVTAVVRAMYHQSIPVSDPVKERQLDNVKELRTLADNLRATSQGLTSRHRSLRFLRAIELLQRNFSGNQAEHLNPCGCPTCKRELVSASDISVLSLCGHVACKTCLADRDHSESCVVPHCKASVHGFHILKAESLGAKDNDSLQTSRGQKMDKLIALLHAIAPADQAILFVQNYDLMDAVKDVLETQKISFCAIQKSAACTAQIEDFQENRDQDTRKKVIVLTLSDESAAGL